MSSNGRAKDYALLIEMLRSQRIALGISQVDLAARLRVNQAYISKSERGERRLDVIDRVL